MLAKATHLVVEPVGTGALSLRERVAKPGEGRHDKTVVSRVPHPSASLRSALYPLPVGEGISKVSKAILIVDDDVELYSLMKDFFAQQGFRSECAHDGHTGLLRALEAGFDLVILDAMLPVLDGFELLRRLRKQSGIPVIMLTARTAQKSLSHSFVSMTRGIDLLAAWAWDLRSHTARLFRMMAASGRRTPILD
jgi:CheY-like chemotaxis protein